MRYIVANKAPQELIAWRAANRNIPGMHYDSGFSTAAKHAVKDQRLRDQGYLCAYTMREIGQVQHGGELVYDGHIEHLVPRSVSKAEDHFDETVHYRNMVVCLPRDGGDESLGYGAAIRKNSPLAVLPRDQDCERRLKFGADGSVSPTIESDAGAKAAIETLKLDHGSLVDMRRSAISAAGLAPARTESRRNNFPNLNRPLSADAAQRLIADVMKMSGGRLPAFCVAIKQAAIAYVVALEKNARRAEFARRRPHDG